MFVSLCFQYPFFVFCGYVRLKLAKTVRYLGTTIWGTRCTFERKSLEPYNYPTCLHIWRRSVFYCDVGSKPTGTAIVWCTFCCFLHMSSLGLFHVLVKPLTTGFTPNAIVIFLKLYHYIQLQGLLN